MRTTIAAAIVAAFAAMALASPAPADDQVVYEDSPGWNCQTMGNRICGPVITDDGIESDTGAYVGGFN